VESEAKEGGYLRVLNSKALDKNGVPVILYEQESNEFTSRVVEKLNKAL